MREFFPMYRWDHDDLLVSITLNSMNGLLRMVPCQLYNVVSFLIGYKVKTHTHAHIHTYTT